MGRKSTLISVLRGAFGIVTRVSAARKTFRFLRKNAGCLVRYTSPVQGCDGKANVPMVLITELPRQHAGKKDPVGL